MSLPVRPAPSRGRYVFQAAAILAAGLVLSAMVVVWGAMRVKQSDQTIVVTGSARQRIISDKVIWRATISFQAPTLAGAYDSLKSSMPRVQEYLKSKGISAEEMTLTSISSETLKQRNNYGDESGPIVGYALRQSVEVRSGNVDLVTKISRESTDLINQGILLQSEPPQYIYTKLQDLKQEMLAEAAKDAKARAEKIAASVGSRVGGVRAARMGVLQITPADSNEVSSMGINDTSSLEKDITSVVSITFAVE
ncbi:MAG: hypothetical protein OHK0029_31060 [Armatimonadaceae bacterium]